MRKFFLLSLVLASIGLAAQTGPFYVAAKTGLSIRDKADVNGKVLDKIPYGTKITLLDNNEELNTIRTEGLLGYWRKVKYNNKTGYIIDSYLFPSAPPKASVKDMRGYLAQMSLPFESKLVVKSGSLHNIEEGGWELQKQLYKNGAEWHKFLGYEYGSNTYFLPDFTMQQAFLLIRMIPEFEEVWGSKDEFPRASKTIKKGQIDYTIKVEQEDMTEEPWIKRISIEYADGAVYSFELFQLDNQIVIFYGSGV
ncbi:MAG: SH3 domain-containing protein [Bacteroidota bacterium]